MTASCDLHIEYSLNSYEEAEFHTSTVAATLRSQIFPGKDVRVIFILQRPFTIMLTIDGLFSESCTESSISNTLYRIKITFEKLNLARAKLVDYSLTIWQDLPSVKVKARVIILQLAQKVELKDLNDYFDCNQLIVKQPEKITGGFLQLLLLKSRVQIVFDPKYSFSENTMILSIMEPFFETRDILSCQEALLDAGYDNV